MTTEPRRIVLLGGTFDPVHNGHLAIATAVRDALEALEAWIIPARMPNLRDAPSASPRDRHDMLAAAVSELPGVRLIDIELSRDGASYTIDTIDELHRAHPSLELWWVLGSDALRRIGEWHRSEELRGRGRFAVVHRAGTAPLDEDELRALGMERDRTRVLPFTPPMVSAGMVRERVARGEAIGDLVPAAVARLIAERRLYVGPSATRAQSPEAAMPRAAGHNDNG